MSVKLWNSSSITVGNGIFVDSSGYIHTVCWASRANPCSLYYAISIDGGVTFTNGEGGGGGTYKTVYASGNYPNACPTVVVNSSGEIFVIWSDNTGQVKFIKKSGGSWGTATNITGATAYSGALFVEIDSDNNIIIFGGASSGTDRYYSCHTSVDGGVNWVEEINTSSNGFVGGNGDLCLGYNSHLYATWYWSYLTNYRIKELKITKTENTPDSWVVGAVDVNDSILSTYNSVAIIGERDSETLWLFRSYKTGIDYQLQYKKKSGGSWGSWTDIVTNTTNYYKNYQVVRTYDNRIYLIYEITGTSTLYYVLWDTSWSTQQTFLASATTCNIQQPNLSSSTSYLSFSYKKSSANEQYFEKFTIPSTIEEIDNDTISLSDEIFLNIPLENIIKSDTIILSDEHKFANEDEQDNDSLSIVDSIFINERPQKLNEIDTLTLSDIIDISRTLFHSEEDNLSLLDEVEIRIPIEFVHNKTSFIAQIIKNIDNKFSMLKGIIIDWTNKFTTRGQGLYKCKNDFRMRLSWQVPGNAGIQSLGKEYIKIYINTIEQTDIDVDSVSISKGINNANNATFTLGRAYDATIPTIESIIEIKYNTWTLFKGYITQITPTSDPENIQVNCQDEMWNQNKTRVYFNVGHLPFSATPGEYYYATISSALSALGINSGFGGFIPQTINCWGSAKSETITQLIEQSGNFGWFYNEDGTPKFWRAGEGDIVTLDEQKIGENLGLYQVLSHSFKSDSSNIVNQYRVQMGNIVNQLGNRQYAGYVYENFPTNPTPLWDASLEVLAKDSPSGYGWDYHDPAVDNLYQNVFTKYRISNYIDFEEQMSKWTDRYEPKVEISPRGFGYICSIHTGADTPGSVEFGNPVGRVKEGYTIDYKNKTITFSQPVYYYKVNAYGEKTEIVRPNLYVVLYKKKYAEQTNIPGSTEYPLWFNTGKMGEYPTTNIGSLALSGLGIQIGGYYTDEDGKRKYIPSWNDTRFASDVANWQLSKECDEKLTGSITLTLDAICFYNIDLSKRIKIPGIINVPLNIVSMSYSLSDFQVTLELENSRSYTRSASVQSRGEDYF